VSEKEILGFDLRMEIIRRMISSRKNVAGASFLTPAMHAFISLETSNNLTLVNQPGFTHEETNPKTHL
jgi:hypothetical protein